MPQLSQRRLVVEWFLNRIDEHVTRKKAIKLTDFLEEPSDSALGTLSITLSLSEKESTFAINDLFLISDEIEEDNTKLEAQRDELLYRRFKELQRILSNQYYASRKTGIPKSHLLRDVIIGQLPIDRFRHYFRMNPYSFLSILDRIRDHSIQKQFQMQAS